MTASATRPRRSQCGRASPTADRSRIDRCREIGRCLAALDPGRERDALRLAERALMKEVVAEPGVRRRRLRRDRLESGVRVDARESREPAAIRNAEHADLAVVVRQLLHQPVDGVVRISRFVGTGRIPGVVLCAIGDKGAARAIATAHVFGHEDVAVLREFGVRRRKRGRAELPRGTEGRANEEDRSGWRVPRGINATAKRVVPSRIGILSSRRS